jgi:hypothetical protein
MKLKRFCTLRKWSLNWRDYPQSGRKYLPAIHKRTDNQNIRSSKTKLPSNQWTDKEMGNWTITELFQKKKFKWPKKNMKKCSPSLAIKEMQIKTTLRLYLTPVRIVKNKCWWGCREKGTLIHCWWKCKVIQPLWKTIWKLVKKTKHRSAIRSSNPTPRDIPKRMWLRLLQRHLHTHVYCSAIHNR